MIRSTLPIAALALAAGTAQAQVPVETTTLIPADRMVDADIYTLEIEEGDWASGAAFEVVNTEWTMAGEVEELVLSSDGTIAGIVAEIDGGLLGIADRTVFLRMEDLRIVPEEIGSRRWAVVTRHAQDALQQLPEVDDDWLDD